MLDIRSSMDKNGRLLIPTQIRKELNYNPGDTFVVRMVDNELRIMSLNKVLLETRSKLKSRLNSDNSLTEEFLNMRRADANIENNTDNIE